MAKKKAKKTKPEWIARTELPSYLFEWWGVIVTLRTIDRWCRDAPTGVTKPLVVYKEGSYYFFKPSDVDSFMKAKTTRQKADVAS